MRAAPRTDPDVRYYRIRLLAQVERDRRRSIRVAAVSWYTVDASAEPCQCQSFCNSPRARPFPPASPPPPTPVGCSGFVRRLPRYYDLVRLPRRVHAGRSATGLPLPDYGQSRSHSWDIPGSAQRAYAHASGLARIPHGGSSRKVVACCHYRASRPRRTGAIAALCEDPPTERSPVMAVRYGFAADSP